MCVWCITSSIEFICGDKVVSTIHLHYYTAFCLCSWHCKSLIDVNCRQLFIGIRYILICLWYSAS